MNSLLMEITETFEFLDEWEDKYKYLIELGKRLEPLDPALHCEQYKVSGCASQVWLYPQWNSQNKLAFLTDSDAHTVKGLLFIALAFYNGKTDIEAIKANIEEVLEQLDLKNHISLQRANGLNAVIQQIKYYAKQHCELGGKIV